MIDKEWLSLKDAANIYSLKVDTLRSYLKTGLISPFATRINRKILLNRVEFDAWINSFRIQKKDDSARVLQNINDIRQEDISSRGHSSDQKD